MAAEREVMIIGAVASVIGAVLSILHEYRNRVARARMIRQPYVNRDSLREANINSILFCGDTHCLGQIRMRLGPFLNLCDILSKKGLLFNTVRMSIREQVVIFLLILGHNMRFRAVGGRLFRSTWSIHHYFHVVLRAVLKLYTDFVRPPRTSCAPEVQDNPRFFPWFEDFVGAIDGTHVRASIPCEMQDRFRNRKGGLSQNVFAAVSFDLKFTYVLAGWEGSAHDSRVLGDALHRGFRAPEGKYYLADAGYGDRKGIMPPFRKVRYHLKEYSKERHPLNSKELFNLRHSSLRMAVERAFGVWKKRFRVLDAEPFWPYETQVDVVLACCVLHNYLRGVDPNDDITREAELEVATLVQSDNTPLTRKEKRLQDEECKRKREAIATAMWNNYKRRRTE